MSKNGQGLSRRPKDSSPHLKRSLWVRLSELDPCPVLSSLGSQPRVAASARVAVPRLNKGLDVVIGWGQRWLMVELSTRWGQHMGVEVGMVVTGWCDRNGVGRKATLGLTGDELRKQ
ncbi:hypothetical protein U1Q18_033661, partial [Sarracenia purpurea var. burkii]